MRQNAADEFALRLKDFADALVSRGMRAQRSAYGPALAMGLSRRRSPKGFLLHSSGPRLVVLLPDGRLWKYHERRNIDGIYYDARTHHFRAMHGSIPLSGGCFSFLGAVVGKYHFGYREGDDVTDTPNGFELGAIVGHVGSSSSYVPVDEAFAAILKEL